MGTNYYTLDVSERCSCCGRGSKEIHIGKSSLGWCFSLHVIPKLGLNTLIDWQKYLKNKVITDEYHDYYTLDDLLNIITERYSTKIKMDDFFFKYYKSYQDFLDKNHAEEGPNNLLRHKVDGVHCIGNGEGTWDYIAGEFS